jgi:protein-disulfide isomerase
VLENYPKEVKLVMKHFPLSFHTFARKASIAALAAGKQGKFWEFHDKLFANQNSLNDSKVQEIAKELSLNLERFKQDLKDPKLESFIERDMNDAQQIDVRGIPTIFVNGKLISNRTLQGLQQVIESELKKKR